MKRREFVIAIGIGAVAAPFTVLGQQPGKIRRIGFFYFGSRQSAMDTGRYAAFVQGMRQLGYTEGKEYAIEARYADGKAERLAALVGELVQSKVDVIVATGTPATRAAQKATTTIPIVITVAADPVADGFAKTFARPGGNITGLSVSAAELSQKYFELLRDVLPKLSRVGVLFNSSNPAHPAQVKTIQATAQNGGIQAFPADGPNPAAIEAGIAGLARERVEAVIILADTFFVQQVRQMAELALKHRLPSVYLTREYPEAGGLMSYGPDITDNFRRAAGYVDRIFKGAKPGELPIEQPAKFELVLNLKTAKVLGIKISQTMLFRTDRRIE